MVLLDYLLGVQVGVRDIAFQPVPTGILLYLVIVDGDGDVLAYVKELVVPSLVHLVLGQRPLGVGFF